VLAALSLLGGAAFETSRWTMGAVAWGLATAVCREPLVTAAIAWGERLGVG